MSVWLPIWLTFFLGTLAAYLRLRAIYRQIVITCHDREQQLRQRVPTVLANLSEEIVDIIAEIMKVNEPMERIGRAKWTMLFTVCIYWIAFSLEFISYSLQNNVEEILILISNTGHVFSMLVGYMGIAFMSLTLLLLVRSEAT